MDGLTAVGFSQVVDIIKRRKSNLLQNSDEIEIDIDTLDTPTLRELQKYVFECLNPGAATGARKAPAKGGGGGKGVGSKAAQASALQVAAQKAIGNSRVGQADSSSDSSPSEVGSPIDP